ncbi:MAG: GAF domain-containing protein [Chloroflexi bacterium]|nr:GAF domain-containing protein [Chloroflexota bacterium]MCI0578318.1 GAF domain-containing protein [Chloroflexota bacterium]MCI0649014.1 GAF domain-containing protein [Chloroflexota bacterium]MCI0729449.1 GAF domain-containing protein [Chloroflexota bacterium]
MSATDEPLPITDPGDRDVTWQGSEERYRAVLENIQDGYYEVDLGGHYTFFNEALCDIFGYSREELLGMSYKQRVDEATAEDMYRCFNQVYKTGAAVKSYEYQFTHGDGSQRTIQISVAPIRDRDNNVVGFRGLGRDVTESKLAQLALLASEERYRLLLEQRRREIRLAAQVAQEIATAANLNELYKRVVTQVKEQFGYYHAQLLRYDPAIDAVVLIAGYGETGARMLAAGHKAPMRTGLIGVAASTGQSVLRPDVAGDPQWQSNPLLPETRGELAVPIKLGEQVLGVLDVQSDTAGALTADDQLALEGLCGQIAVAIESTRLRQEMADRLRELDQLHRILSREGWQSFRATHAKSAQGYLFDRASVQPVGSEEQPPSGNGHSQPQEESVRSVAAENAITTPMTVRGEVIGALGIEDDPANPLSPEDQELLASISVQVAEALEGARLLEQIQRRASELETVARVSAVASTILDASRLLQTVVDLTKERFDLYHVSIFLFNEEDLRLELAAGSGEIGKLIQIENPVLPLHLPKSIISRAGRTRQAIVVNDVRAAPDYMEHPLLSQTRSELAIPLVVGDQLLGVLDVQSEMINRFTEDDVRVQSTLAAQVAVALQNAYLYAEQLAAAERLREVDRLKSEFLASMSHELRTPLNSIIGFADVILEGIDGPLTERMEEDVTLIRDSGRHLRELIGHILDMSKIEAGMMELRYEQVNVQQVAREIIANARSLALDKDITVRLEIDPDVETVEADRTRLTQVLFNLISNAIKFTEKGSVTLVIGQKNDQLLVSVIDTGIGIRKEDVPIIFEQFRQIDGSLTRRHGGTGLGLPISRSLVELHGGEMWVESEPDIGSTFSFSIPVQKAAKKGDTGPLARRGHTGPLRPLPGQSH